MTPSEQTWSILLTRNCRIQIQMQIYLNNRQLIKMQKSIKNTKINTGRWTRAEHQKFMDALEKYGRDWAKIQKKLKTRSLLQIRSHAQKVFLNMSQKDIRAFIGSDQESFFDRVQPLQKFQEKNASIPKTPKERKKVHTERNNYDNRKLEEPSDANSIQAFSQGNVQIPKCFNSSDSSIIVSEVVNQRPQNNQASSDRNQESLFLRIFRENQSYFRQGGNFLQYVVYSQPVIS